MNGIETSAAAFCLGPERGGAFEVRRGAAKFPLVLGNDFAGTVTAAGAAVSAFKLAMRFGASGRHAMYGKF